MNLIENFPEETFTIMPDHDNAILGICDNSRRVIYSKAIVIQNLTKDMPLEDAIEYYHFNILGSYIGDTTPIFLETGE